MIERLLYVFLLDGVFLAGDHGLDFNQSINRRVLLPLFRCTSTAIIVLYSSITVGFSPILHYTLGPMLLPFGSLIVSHQEFSSLHTIYVPTLTFWHMSPDCVEMCSDFSLKIFLTRSKCTAVSVLVIHTESMEDYSNIDACERARIPWFLHQQHDLARRYVW